MEELKILVNMVASLPQMALWVIAFFFAYKVMIIGSIYGVIRFCVERLYQWAITPREKILKVTADFEGLLFSNVDKAYLRAQLFRLTNTSYVHNSHIDVLKQALDEYQEKHKTLRN